MGDRKKRVLIVDDDPLNLRLMARMLNQPDVEVELAGSGAAAIAMAMKGDYDVVFLDISMPAIGGVTVARSIRQQLGPKSPRIVACTAHHQFVANQGAEEASHFDAVLTKPFVRGDVLRLMQQQTA